MRLFIIRVVRWCLRNLCHPLFEWYQVKKIRAVVLADPTKGDYCFRLQGFNGEPDKARRNQYCLERTIVGHVCPAQCKWGLRIASNRQRARAIREAKAAQKSSPVANT
jgi:hypothetical protein